MNLRPVDGSSTSWTAPVRSASPQSTQASPQDTFQPTSQMTPAEVRTRLEAQRQGTHRKVQNAVIIGGGPAGLAAAIKMMERGVHVTVLEARSADYQRPHQLNLRQSSLDQMADLGVYNDVAAASGWTDASARTGMAHGESWRVINEPSVAQVRISDTERALYDKAVKMGMEYRDHTEANLIPGADGMYQVETYPVAMRDGKFVPSGPRSSPANYDLVVVADGAGSPTRQKLGIPMLEESPAHYYLGALVDQPIGPEYRKIAIEARDGKLLHVMATGHSRYPQTWVSVEADGKVVNMTPKQRAELVRRRAEAVMDRALKPEDLGWGAGQMTVVQNRRAATTVAGNNVVMMGDASRTGSVWVSGGLNLALTADLQDLVRLVDTLNHTDKSREYALHAYDVRAQQASRDWHKAGEMELNGRETVQNARVPVVCPIFEDPI